MLKLNLPKIRNKRGAEDMLVDFWAILVFAIIVIIFLIWFSIDKGNVEKNVRAEFASKDVQFMLDSFLRAPLVDNPSKTVSDVIVEDATTGNFSNTERLFEEYFERTTVVNSEDINDILLKIDGSHSDTYRITAEKGKGQLGKGVKIVFEQVKRIFEDIATSPGPTGILTTIGIHQETVHYNAQAYLPNYDKKIHVEIAVVTWVTVPI